MIDKGLSQTTIEDTSHGADGTTTYSVFPGVEFSFVDVHGHQIIREKKIQVDNILEITYCREGRSEFNLNDEFVFLSPGDLMIVKASKGEQLRINIAGRNMRDPSWFGMAAEKVIPMINPGNHVIHTGGKYDSYVQLAVVPPKYKSGDYIYRG